MSPGESGAVVQVIHTYTKCRVPERSISFGGLAWVFERHTPDRYWQDVEGSHPIVFKRSDIVLVDHSLFIQTDLRSRKLLPMIIVIVDRVGKETLKDIQLRGGTDFLLVTACPMDVDELLTKCTYNLLLYRCNQYRFDSIVKEVLLTDIFPSSVRRAILRKGKSEPERHECVSIMFVDIVGFTRQASLRTAEYTFKELEEVFSTFDDICRATGVYKVETRGDEYMAVSGHDGMHDHASRILKAAVMILEAVRGRVPALEVRVGIHCGPTVSGVLGKTRQRYCFAGDTVNMASRMESSGEPMTIHVTEDFVEKIGSDMFEALPILDVKGKGSIQTYRWRADTLDNVLFGKELSTPHPDTVVQHGVSERLQRLRSNAKDLSWRHRSNLLRILLNDADDAGSPSHILISQELSLSEGGSCTEVAR